MNIINKYVYKNLKLNKVRSIVTIIGIMLSCALITALFGLITSFQKAMINMAIDNYGNSHVTFLNVPNQELENVINNKNVESYYINENIGYSKLVGSANTYKPYLFILGYDNESFNSLENKLLKGRLPKNENEIVISEHIKYDALVDLKVGEYITLNVGKRMSEGFELTQENPYIKDNVEELTETNEKKFKIVGIVERPNFELITSPGYTVFTKINKPVNNINVSVLYKDAKKYETSTKEILNTTDKEKAYGVTYNNDLIQAQGLGFSSGTMRAIYTVGFILAFIIVITSVFCIRNSFIISVSEKTKSYGMFASIGATPKQIKKSVLYEGFLLGVIGTVFGIFFGIIASFILVKITNALLNDSVTGLLEFNISLFGILISMVLTFITIYASCIGSAKRASKLSEIESIKLTKNIKNKKIKENKLITKMFGVTGNISYKNMKRNKSKFRVTIISISLCIMTFITMSTFIELGFSSVNEMYEDIKFNIIVDELKPTSDGELYSSDVNKILKMDNINKHSYLRYMNMNLSSDEELYVQVYSVGREEYARYIKSLGYKYDEVKGLAFVKNQYKVDKETNKYTDEYMLDEKTKNITLINGSDQRKTTKTNIKFVDTLPMGFELSFSNSPTIVISDEMFDEIYKQLNVEGIDHELFINSSNASKLNETLNKYIEDNDKDFYVVNVEAMANQMHNMIILVSIFLYGFISVITLIGITNIFNTITTSMNLRKQEFAILQSVGMSKKELNNMILFESMLYGIKSLMFGIPLGILGSYFMYKATTFSTTSGEIINSYNLPIGSILISIVFAFIIILLIMKLSISKINKQNIIETIRNENI